MKKLIPLLVLALAFWGCSDPHADSASHDGHNHGPGEQHAVAEAGSEEASAAAEEMCVGHGVLEAECGICDPGRTAELKPGEGMKVRLPVAGSASGAGVSVGAALPGTLPDGLDCLAEITFDQNKVARLTAPVGGILQSIEVDLGDRVEEQATVARIWSATIAEAVAKAVLTHQNLERERKLRAERVTSERDLQQAEAEHRAACHQARTLGFSEEQIDAFGAKPEEPVMLEVRAPFAGEIVERTAVRGALVEPGKPLFMLVDRSTMWAMLNLPESALGRVSVGQEVRLRVESLPGREFTGKLTWIAAQVDDRTRMASARVELPNPDGVLRANMFARARILTAPAQESVVLPASAVHRVHGRPIVFVRLEEDLYEARVVRLGASSRDTFEVVEGLRAGEPIVVKHGFPLKSQLLSSRLGAGCAHE